jgi:hypothetical protein
LPRSTPMKVRKRAMIGISRFAACGEAVIAQPQPANSLILEMRPQAKDGNRPPDSGRELLFQAIHEAPSASTVLN